MNLTTQQLRHGVAAFVNLSVPDMDAARGSILTCHATIVTMIGSACAVDLAADYTLPHISVLIDQRLGNARALELPSHGMQP